MVVSDLRPGRSDAFAFTGRRDAVSPARRGVDSPMCRESFRFVGCHTPDRQRDLARCGCSGVACRSRREGIRHAPLVVRPDYGEFFGKKVTHYVKDVPLSRVAEGDVLIAHTLNAAPLSPEHGYPARLVVPGFYGTNSVKWLCRLELADARPVGPFTTELYNDPVEGGGTKPVWEIEPESIFVFPRLEDTLRGGVQRIWGRAWSSAEVVSVEVSFDGGEVWNAARLTPRVGRAWQTFVIDWQPPASGKYRLQCRATDADGKKQPVTGARNAIHSVDVVAEAD